MDSTKLFNETITTKEEPRSLIGTPSELAVHKVISELDEHCRHFITQSPFLFMSTSDQTGQCDVTPRGDAPGFVLILNNKHLVIPERPGNRRMDSMYNIIENPHAGLIFVIPGLEETLRINGRACIIRDQSLLEQMQVKGRNPVLGIGIEIEECFIHCAKAFKRSHLWNPESWPKKEKLPSIPSMMAAHIKRPDISAELIEQSLAESYTKRLY
jgi:PPOX class probable FMN-dependent enzyme